jgi:hypothetical protein
MADNTTNSPFINTSDVTAKIHSETRNVQCIHYPLELNDEYLWAKFEVFHRKAQRKKASRIEDPIACVYMPLPADLRTSYRMNYANEDLKVVGRISQGVAGNARSGAGALGAISQLIAKFSNEHIASLAADQAISAASAITPNLVQGVLHGGGFATNPHMAVLFSGVNFRSHTFNYRMIPESEKESIAARDIVKLFKRHMHPTYMDSAGNFFDYPDEFMISFRDGPGTQQKSTQGTDTSFNEGHTFVIGNSVLSALEVSYHGASSYPAWHSLQGGGSAPAEISLNMTFQETFILSQNDIDDEGF